MKRFAILLTGLSCFTASLFGEIHTAEHFSDIFKYVQPDTLILLDIDDTILVPVQTLGTDIWFQNRYDYHKEHEADKALALDKALAEWEAIRHLTQMELVESETTASIAQLQNLNHTVMGLTTQGLALTTRTIQQLASFSIDLSKTAPSSDDHYFINQHGVLYRHGILFTSGTKKGTALLKLLSLMEIQPTHILFINDKLTHLRDVEESVEKQGIAFTGLRYAYSDERVASYNAELADIQWKNSSFDHILSDAEAAELLQAGVAR